jgi:malate dehydrogenase (oxaloacetate-decarboxylating)(NADP+)
MNEKFQPAGFQVLNSASLNKGTAFTQEERRKFKLRGLLPPKTVSLEIQIQRTLVNIRKKHNDIERYTYLASLQSRNERLFYNIIINNFKEIMPLIYTPTRWTGMQRVCAPVPPAPWYVCDCA